MHESALTRPEQMIRAAIYARFSTDLQDERSIEDQVSLCKNYAEREQLHVVAVFDDHARSGGSILGRDGLLALMDKARERAFEVIVVEALDRLSRDMEDLAGIHKRLSFLGIEIRAVHEGVVNTVLVGLRGLVALPRRQCAQGAKGTGGTHRQRPKCGRSHLWLRARARRPWEAINRRGGSGNRAPNF